MELSITWHKTTEQDAKHRFRCIERYTLVGPYRTAGEPQQPHLMLSTKVDDVRKLSALSSLRFYTSRAAYGSLGSTRGRNRHVCRLVRVVFGNVWTRHRPMPSKRRLLASNISQTWLTRRCCPQETSFSLSLRLALCPMEKRLTSGSRKWRWNHLARLLWFVHAFPLLSLRHPGGMTGYENTGAGPPSSSNRNIPVLEVE